MHQHILVLPNAVGAIRGLVLNRGIPPPIEVNHVRGRGQIESSSTCFQRKHKKAHGFIFLEAAHQVLAALHRSFSVKHQPRASEDRAQKRRQRGGYLAKLREHQHLLLTGSNHLPLSGSLQALSPSHCEG